MDNAFNEIYRAWPDSAYVFDCATMQLAYQSRVDDEGQRNGAWTNEIAEFLHLVGKSKNRVEWGKTE